MKIGRNQTCSCGSGKKYKKCCMQKEEIKALNIAENGFARRKLRDTEGKVFRLLLEFTMQRLGRETFEEGYGEFLLWEDWDFEESFVNALKAVFLTWMLYDCDIDELFEEMDPPDDLLFPLKSLAQLYLDENPGVLDDFQRQYLEEACSQPYSYFQVIHVEPGKTITLKDLFLPRTYKVLEKMASLEDLKGDIFFTKVVSIDGASIMVGAFPVVIPPVYQGSLIDFRENLEYNGQNLTKELMRKYDFELRENYFEIYQKLLNPPMPELRNTDDESMVPTELIYEIKCSPAEAFRELKSLAYGMKEENLLSDAVYDQNGELEKIDFSWLKKGNKMHRHWKNTIMGSIKIDNTCMNIEVNSDNRSRIIQEEIKKRLKNKAIFKRTVVSSVEKLMEESLKKEDVMDSEEQYETSRELKDSSEVRQKIPRVTEKYWENWLNTRIPMLGNLTPREAVNDPVARDKLDGLFLYLESMKRKRPQDYYSLDVAKLKRMLELVTSRGQKF